MCVRMCVYIRNMYKIYYKELVTQLWRLTGPNICSWQAGDTGKLMAESSLESEGLRSRCEFQSKSRQAEDPVRADISV